MSEEMKDVVERVTKYLTERAKMRQLDPDLIHGLHEGDDREAYLTVSDLRALLSERRKMVEALEMCMCLTGDPKVQETARAALTGSREHGR